MSFIRSTVTLEGNVSITYSALSKAPVKCHKVFNITELRDEILGHLTPAETVRVSRVCKAFRDSVCDSPTLLTSTFFRPRLLNTHAPSLLPYGIPGFRIRHAQAHGVPTISATLDDRNPEVRRGLLTWQESSLRYVLLSQPPPHQIRIYADCWCVEPLSLNAESVHGIRLGHLLRAIKRFRTACTECGEVYSFRLNGIPGSMV